MILGMTLSAFIQLIFLIGAGIYDLYLYFSGRKTISQKIHAWFPKVGDAIVLIGIMALIWACIGPDFFVTALWGVILGHLFWQE